MWQGGVCVRLTDLAGVGLVLLPVGLLLGLESQQRTTSRGQLGRRGLLLWLLLWLVCPLWAAGRG